MEKSFKLTMLPIFHVQFKLTSYKCIQKINRLKGETMATRAASKWGGVMIKFSGLSRCLLYSAFYFNSVVCRLLSVSYQEFKQHQWLCLQHRVHNSAYTNQPLPRQIQILNLTVGFFPQTHVIKIFSEYNQCYIQSRCLQSFISKLFVNIS